MKIPEKYLAGLTPQQRLIQQRLIRQSQREYKKEGMVSDRPRVSDAPTKRSSHAKRFEDRYGFPVTDLKKVKEKFPTADVDKILARGRGAYMSSGSRPNVSASAWAYARLASALTGGKASKIDKDLL